MDVYKFISVVCYVSEQMNCDLDTFKVNLFAVSQADGSLIPEWEWSWTPTPYKMPQCFNVSHSFGRTSKLYLLVVH